MARWVAAGRGNRMRRSIRGILGRRKGGGLGLPSGAVGCGDGWLRWENTKSETGPWSAMVSATITG